MKRLILIKLCNDSKLAHLYQYLYCYGIGGIFDEHDYQGN